MDDIKVIYLIIAALPFLCWALILWVISLPQTAKRSEDNRGLLVPNNECPIEVIANLYGLVFPLVLVEPARSQPYVSGNN